MAHPAPSLLLMNDLHPLHRLETIKSPDDDADRQGDIEIPMLTMSLPPLIMRRSCPGQATPACSTPTSDPSIISTSLSSLIRFIDSSVFSVHHAMHYLNKCSESAVWECVARRLFAYPTAEVDFYLPQLLILFLRSAEGTRCLLPYLSHRVNTSLRFAIQLAWLLDIHNTSSPPSAARNALRVLNAYSLDAILSTTSLAAVEVAKKSEDADAKAKAETETATEEEVGGLTCLTVGEHAASKSADPPARPATLLTKVDAFTKHKRAASDQTRFSGCDIETAVQVEVLEGDLLEAGSEGEASSNSDEDNYTGVQAGFNPPKPVRSESWVRMHSSFCKPTASRSDTHLHVRRPRLKQTTPFASLSFSTVLLGLPASQTQQLRRLQDTLTDFLDAAAAIMPTPMELTSKRSFRSDKLISFCRSQWDFVNALLSISRRLTAFASKEQRTSHLQAELYKVNLGLPARVWLPVESKEHIVLRIPPSAAVCLNSAEKAPYLVYVEILACDHVLSARLPARTGSATGLMTLNSLNYHCHDTDDAQAAFLPSKVYLSGAKAIAAPDVISLRSTDSAESVTTCETTATTDASVSSHPVTDQNGEKEERRMSEVSYVNAREIRRRLEENDACQPQRSFKLDPEDPSAAVLKEPWDSKARRIQESSPWGHLPNWHLAAAIIKVGDDLRQEQLAYQLLSHLQKIWSENHIALWLRPLNIVIISPDSGFIELVQDTVSLHQIRRHARLSLRDYIIREHGPPNSEGFLNAQRNFVQSCAAYCLVGYLFHVKDRHNGNILIDKEGHVVHIDYGFMLSASPGRNLGFETSPFKLTAEQVELMGGVNGDMFTYYKALILHGFLAARKYMDELILLVEITQSGYPQLPCFGPGGGARTVEALRHRFMFTSTEEQVTRFVDCMVRQSMNSLTTRLYDNYQYYANGIQ